MSLRMQARTIRSCLLCNLGESNLARSGNGFRRECLASTLNADPTEPDHGGESVPLFRGEFGTVLEKSSDRPTACTLAREQVIKWQHLMQMQAREGTYANDLHCPRASHALDVESSFSQVVPPDLDFVRVDYSLTQKAQLSITDSEGTAQ